LKKTWELQNERNKRQATWKVTIFENQHKYGSPSGYYNWIVTMGVQRCVCLGKNFKGILTHIAEYEIELDHTIAPLHKAHYCMNTTYIVMAK
jgi:hypothetical protein